MTESKYIPGQIVVFLKVGASEERLKDFLAENGLVLANLIWPKAVYLVGVPVGEELKWKERIVLHQDVDGAELNILCV